MNLFEKTKYTICFISVSDACTWQAIKIEENFQKSPRPTKDYRLKNFSNASRHSRRLRLGMKDPPKIRTKETKD